jgi:chromosome segregation ATPase
MKVLTLTTIGTVAAVLAFSTGCSQSKIEELSTQLDDAYTNLVHTEQQLTKAKRAQKEAEREMTVAQDQSETAYVNLHKVQRQLAEQKQRVGQLQRVHSLKMAEYEAFVAKTAQALAAKDKKISELSAPVK